MSSQVKGTGAAAEPGIVAGMLVLLTDRSPATALPALDELHLDLKTEPLALGSLAHILRLGPDAVLVDAAENPGQGFTICTQLQATDARLPVLVLVEREQLARYPWHEVAEDFLYPGAPEQEIVVSGTVKSVDGDRVVVDTVAAQGDSQIIRNAEAELQL